MPETNQFDVDRFAMAALTGILASGEYIGTHLPITAVEAYDLAEAMVSERAKRIAAAAGGAE